MFNVQWQAVVGELSLSVLFPGVLVRWDREIAVGPVQHDQIGLSRPRHLPPTSTVWLERGHRNLEVSRKSTNKRLSLAVTFITYCSWVTSQHQGTGRSVSRKIRSAVPMNQGSISGNTADVRHAFEAFATAAPHGTLSLTSIPSPQP